MRISVVLPVRDGDRWLDEALDSLAAQTRPADEVIVVDDGSRDRSRALVDARPWATLIDGPQAGITAAYRTGVTATTGDAVGFLAQDDRYAPTALALLSRALDDDAGAAYACGQVVPFTDETRPFPGLRAELLDRPSLARVPETVLIRREWLERVGMPDGSGTAWDIELFLRLNEAGARMAGVDEVVAHKRLRPDSTVHAGPVHRDILAAVRRSVERRRAAEDGGVENGGAGNDDAGGHAIGDDATEDGA
jgi:glycosyltransferase involved in cell wall biosynthesis